ncbi:hypothetical protein EYF80_034949 [Liparis tanakae]|uniref:Uncharacterized protein n=1 Tax=Liparis tanakae TaxID=230148 RepID=A0A4Z2GNN8_9TELE|nr:hypothetical protein EYF80_034949 [Liparis tanakae]
MAKYPQSVSSSFRWGMQFTPDREPPSDTCFSKMGRSRYGLGIESSSSESSSSPHPCSLGPPLKKKVTIFSVSLTSWRRKEGTSTLLARLALFIAPRSLRSNFFLDLPAADFLRVPLLRPCVFRSRSSAAERRPLEASASSPRLLGKQWYSASSTRNRLAKNSPLFKNLKEEHLHGGWQVYTPTSYSMCPNTGFSARVSFLAALLSNTSTRHSMSTLAGNDGETSQGTSSCWRRPCESKARGTLR